MVFDSKTLPPFMPVGEYRIDVQLFTNMNGKEEFIMMSQDYIEVKPLEIIQF